MFKLVEKIENVCSYDLYEDKLLFLSIDRQIPNIPNIDLSIFETKHNGEIFVSGSYLVWQDGRGMALVYNLLESKIIFLNDHIDLKYSFKQTDARYSEKDLICMVRNDEVKTIQIFDGIRRKFLNLKINTTVVWRGDHVLCVYDQKINQLSFIDFSGEILWNYQIEGTWKDLRGKEVSSKLGLFLGEAKECIWFTLNSGVLIILKKDSGELISKFDNANYESLEFVSRGLKLDVKNNRFLALNNRKFLDQNLNGIINGAIQDFEELNLDNLSASYRNTFFPFDDVYIYFCDDQQGVIGTLDRKEKRLVWKYALEIKKEGIAQILDMKYHSGRLYVHDRFNSLYIFEKRKIPAPLS